MADRTRGLEREQELEELGVRGSGGQGQTLHELYVAWEDSAYNSYT